MLYSPLKILCSREKDQKSPESKGVLGKVNVKQVGNHHLWGVGKNNLSAVYELLIPRY